MCCVPAAQLARRELAYAQTGLQIIKASGFQAQ